MNFVDGRKVFNIKGDHRCEAMPLVIPTKEKSLLYEVFGFVKFLAVHQQGFLALLEMTILLYSMKAALKN